MSRSERNFALVALGFLPHRFTYCRTFGAWAHLAQRSDGQDVMVVGHAASAFRLPDSGVYQAVRNKSDVSCACKDYQPGVWTSGSRSGNQASGSGHFSVDDDKPDFAALL